MGRGRQNGQDDRERLRYSEVLRMAHEKYTHGLNISAKLEQAPNEENGNRAISSAIVVGMRLGPDSGIIEERWIEWGDADPTNVGRMIVPHIIRMSNTRAKARALRDAVNRGEATLEEMGGDDDEPRQQRRAPLMNEPAARAPAPEDAGVERGGASATQLGLNEGQLKYVERLAESLGTTTAAFEEEFGDFATMEPTRRSTMVNELNRRKREATPGG